MLLRRIVAQVIDIFVLIAGTAFGVYLAAQMNLMVDESFVLLTYSEVALIILVPIGLQSLFWIECTTIGKMFVFLEVVSTDEDEMNYFRMLTREYVSKILSCFLVCLPVFAKKFGIHEVVTGTALKIKGKMS